MKFWNDLVGRDHRDTYLIYLESGTANASGAGDLNGGAVSEFEIEKSGGADVCSATARKKV